MSRIRDYARAFAAALAAMLAFTIELVWDGSRWVARMVRGSLAPLHQEVVAEAVLDAEVEADAGESAARAAFEARRHVTDFGLAALFYLAGDDAARSEARQGLDEASIEYLDGLGLLDAQTLARAAPHRIAEHVLGQRYIEGLPRPETADERAVRRAEEAQYREEVSAILEDLLVEDERRPLAA